jgi:hypothetical protein
MSSEGLLGYEYVEESGKSQLTGRAGLLPYIDLLCVLGVLGQADEKIGIGGSQGWMDRQHVLALILLNLAGGECVEDIRLLEADEGLGEVVRQAEKYGLSKTERRGLESRFRRGRDHTFPSPTRLYEYLNEFHNADQEDRRVEGKAFIPGKNEHLAGLCEVNTVLLSSVVRHSVQREATLDIDATLAGTNKKEALYCYDGYRAYQPISTYWAETGLIVCSEFRDGNVPAGHDMLRIVKESIACLPAGVEKIRLRMDSAGYQHNVLRFCATGDEGRRDIIEFTVSNDMTEEFRSAVMEVAEEDWRPLYRTERGRIVATGARVGRGSVCAERYSRDEQGQAIPVYSDKGVGKARRASWDGRLTGADNPTVCHRSMFWADLPSKGNSDQPRDSGRRAHQVALRKMRQE